MPDAGSPRPNGRTAAFALRDADGLPQHLTVRDVLESVTKAVTAALPADVWVKGEVVGFKGLRAGRLYFDLVDRRVREGVAQGVEVLRAAAGEQRDAVGPVAAP